jgi:hypothetical protein
MKMENKKQGPPLRTNNIISMIMFACLLFGVVNFFSGSYKASAMFFMLPATIATIATVITTVSRNIENKKNQNQL